jgi:acyl carrier protein
MLEELIKKYLIETVGVNPDKFEDPALRVEDLNLDSLGLIEMLFEVEDKFGFQIPDPMLFLNLSFSEMVSTMEEMVRVHSVCQAPKVEPIAHV